MRKFKEKIELDEAIGMLKTFSSILMLEGIEGKDLDKMLLSNTISVAIASIELGESFKVKLMKALSPLNREIGEEIHKKNPELKDLHAVKMSEMFDKDGNPNKEKIEDLIINDIDLKEALKGTGARTQD